VFCPYNYLVDPSIRQRVRFLFLRSLLCSVNIVNCLETACCFRLKVTKSLSLTQLKMLMFTIQPLINTQDVTSASEVVTTRRCNLERVKYAHF